MSYTKNGSSGRSRWLVLMILIAVFSTGSALSQQADSRSQPEASSVRLPNAPQPMPNRAAINASIPETPELALAAGAPAQAASQSGASQASGTEQQQSPQKPVGTAAAPPEGAAGVTASRPAGAVIAPAKQRRARTILIRVGLLVGAGVALGTVLALTHATPSQPQ